MMVFDKDPGRVMWIDFCKAQVDDGVFYSPETLQKEQHVVDQIVNEIGQRIASWIVHYLTSFTSGSSLGRARSLGAKK